MQYDPNEEKNEWRSDRDSESASAPTEPETPVEPEIPTEPETPIEPVTPVEPEMPTEPEMPVEPEIPTEPTAPAEPLKKKPGGTGVFIGVMIGLVCVVLIGAVAAVVFTLGGLENRQPFTPGGASGQSAASVPTISAPGITLEELIAMDSKDNLAPRDAYKKILPSVVSIKCYESMAASAYGGATGLVISEDGYLLTNHHVVEDAAMLMVMTNDGKTYQADVIASDPETDIAVIKIDATGLQPAEFASSEQTEVGQFVMVVGNPSTADLQNSSTFGILSGKSRVSSSDSYGTLLQVDAAINPGNSGGPLINLAGQVIGLVSSKIAGVNYEGLGFAIPSDEVLDVSAELLKNGYVSGRVRMGVSISELTTETVLSNNLPGNVIVAGINEDTDAATKLKLNDIITAADGQTVTSSAQLIAIVRTHKPGEKVELSVYRQSGGVIENLTVRVEVYEYIAQ